ncbi:NFACT family protein [Aerococcaceae bacterium DSM 111021]|nr:NFACT family protein [Aerococcaceae bacterium DSM 111021]
MSFDGFYTHKITEELTSKLKNGRIHKIYQPFEQELQFVIRSNRTNYRLEASIHPMYYRMHLTDEKSNNPQQAPMFCMLLRKHLENATVLDIRQFENDRIITFELSGRDELGDLQSYLLIFELMGRHSNIILVNPVTKKIIDCIKHIPPSMNSFRSLQPGAEYILPPKNETQKNIFELNNTELDTFATEHQELLAAGKASKVIQGMSALASKQISAWISDNNLSSSQALSKYLEELKSGQPVIFRSDNQMKFYAMDLPYLNGERDYFPTLSASLDLFYNQKVRLDRVKQLSGDLIQRLKQVIEKNYHKLDNLQKDRLIAEDADIYRLKGELINAFSYQIEKGQSSTIVQNYYKNNEPYTIELNPRKTPSENSQAYFKRYTKYRDSLRYIEKQEKLATEEIEYLESVLVQLDQAEIEDIEDIKAELVREGYGGKRNKTIKKRAKSKSKPRQYKSSDGVIMYVGRNNQQNDELSMRKASKNHWWLHTKDIPGAHVIVESDKPSDQTMTEAAEIAAYYSKSQNSANVPVDTVQVKHLRKPNGAKPGYVIYEGQNTLYVTPKADKIESLELK